MEQKDILLSRDQIIQITNGWNESIKDTPIVRDNKDIQEPDETWFIDAIQKRSAAIAASVKETIKGSQGQIYEVVKLFLKWMEHGTIVRVLGAGRARLAAAIPANRLAHGGARVYVQDDIMPMPHAINGGGIIAASASGKTPTLLEIMSVVKKDAPHVTVMGIADANAVEFHDLCKFSIGIREDLKCPCPLRALADVGEYVISEVLDALVVAAGKLGGFDERRWRLGHENIGPTGPYDVEHRRAILTFSENISPSQGF